LAEFIVGNPLRKLAREHRLLQRLLWRLDYALVWLLAWLATRLPVDAASRFGARIGRWVGPRMKRKTAIFRGNLAIAFPELSDAALDALVVDAWGQAGRVLGEYPHLETILREDERLEIDIREPIATCSDPDRPSVVVSAHLSNWEVVCSAMAKLGMPNVSLYSPPTNPLLNQLLMDSRQALNCQLLPRDNSARLLMRALKEGRTAGLVMDRRVDDGKPVQFFGRDKESTILPAKLALKNGCDLIPAQVIRLRDARYRVIFHPPVRPRNPGSSETEQAIDMIQQIHLQFEDWIRQHPADWFCSKRLWPKNAAPTQPEVNGDDAGIDSYAA
jgi:KDO2-lipid IV(A) lauroyltransferase